MADVKRYSPLMVWGATMQESTVSMMAQPHGSHVAVDDYEKLAAEVSRLRHLLEYEKGYATFLDTMHTLRVIDGDDERLARKFRLHWHRYGIDAAIREKGDAAWEEHCRADHANVLRARAALATEQNTQEKQS